MVVVLFPPRRTGWRKCRSTVCIFLLLAFLACSGCIRMAAAATKACRYTIKAGDNLNKLSVSFKTTVANLKSLNPGIVPTRLRVGQVINVPCTKQDKSCPQVAGYTVNAGMDHFGGDIDCGSMTLSVASGRCSSDSNCLAFNTYLSGSVQAACTKRVASPISPSAVAGICFYTKQEIPGGCAQMEGYTVSGGMDHYGDDIDCAYMSTSAAQGVCSSNTDCLAFNVFPSGGMVMACTKRVASPTSPSTVANICLYVKKQEPPPTGCSQVLGYTVSAGADHVGDDITCEQMSLAAATSRCSGDSSCAAFNVFKSGGGVLWACTKRVAGPTSPSSVDSICFYTRNDKPDPGPDPGPSGPFVFGPYKDLGINMNWNTYTISTAVTGELQPVLQAMPSNLDTITWAFATGQCGSENWVGMQPSAIAQANIQSMVSAGKKYIISTGGAGGTFTCDSDSGFNTFLNTYMSSSLIGIDFDIEAGQSENDIRNLVERVKTARAAYPSLRFSFTVATMNEASGNQLNAHGTWTMQAIQSSGLDWKNVFVNLMVMDYGSSVSDMGQAAVNAAQALYSYWRVPYSSIELTPMIGGNDTPGETFTLGDVTTMASFVKANGLGGVHYWSFDRDTDCPPGAASATCNTFGQAGTLGFTRTFLNNLG